MEFPVNGLCSFAYPHFQFTFILFIMSQKLKKIPKRVQEVQHRLIGMKLIDSRLGKTLDYGSQDHPLTSAIADAKNEEYLAYVSKYNQMKKELDSMKYKMNGLEKEMLEIGTRVLSGVRGKFGFDSQEVEIIGGVSTSKRKVSRKKNVPLPGFEIKVA